MINKIEICNVNFGDCFICKDDNIPERMLVDFGSMQKISSTIIKEVNRQLSNDADKYLMISHFHSDHYNGIKHLVPSIKFSEIYLPNFFSKSIIRLEYAILLALSSSNRSYAIAYNMLSIIPALLNHIQTKTKIIFTRRGDIIMNRIDSLRVLWPNNIDNDDLAIKIYRKLVTYYDFNEKIELIDKFVEKYFLIFPPLREDENHLSYIQFDEKLLYDLSSLINDLNNSLKNSKIKSKKLASSLNKEISSFQNSICLCFDNFIDNNDKPVLFLSDITKENFDKISNSDDDIKLAEYYHVIKASHHGTKDYYVNNLPKNNYIIISNGNSKTNSWRITALYGWTYYKSNFICTNYFNTCDYELAADKCYAYKSCGACRCFIHNYFDLII